MKNNNILISFFVYWTVLSCQSNKSVDSGEHPTDTSGPAEYTDGDADMDVDGDADTDIDGDADSDSDTDGDTDTDTDGDSDGNTDMETDSRSVSDTEDDLNECAYLCAANCLTIGGTPMKGTCKTIGYKCCKFDMDEETDGDTDTDNDVHGDADSDTDTNTDADTDTDTDTGTDTDANTDTGADEDTGTIPHPFKGVGNSPKSEIERYGVSWCYNWMSSPQKTDCDDPLFVPMIWGGGDVAGEYAKIVNAGYTTVLGFNEPNKNDQSNMSVEKAIALWPALTSNPDVRVGSPSVSDDGRWWLEDFMTQIEEQSLRVDFITVHWYGWNAGSCDTAGGLEGALNWAEKWNRPLWLTEFGCMHESNPNPETVENFYKDALEMFKRHPKLERYAWYPWNTYSHLTDDNGNLTGLGELFSAAPAYRE